MKILLRLKELNTTLIKQKINGLKLIIEKITLILPKLIEKLKKILILTKSQSRPTISAKQKFLNEIKVYDDVLVSFNNEKPLLGWVVEKKGNFIEVVYTDKDQLKTTTFTISRPYNRTQIIQDNKTLILV